MPKKSTAKASTATSKVTEHNHNDLIKRIAVLEAEIATLKEGLKNNSTGEADPRVSILWKALDRMGKGKYLK